MESKTLGNYAKVQLPLVSTKTIQSKIDTGATMCSIHATNISVTDDSFRVNFANSVLSDHTLTFPLHRMLTVSSADGGEVSRPTVLLDIVIDGTQLKDVEFNLSDRSEMDAKILIGQNVLQQGFIIDPQADHSMKESAPVDSSQLHDQQLNPTAPDLEQLIDYLTEVLDNSQTRRELFKLLSLR